MAANTPNRPDMYLLVGVLGGGDISKGSGKLIYDDLKKIIDDINKKDSFKIKISPDKASLQQIAAEVQKIINNMGGGKSGGGKKSPIETSARRALDLYRQMYELNDKNQNGFGLKQAKAIKGYIKEFETALKGTYGDFDKMSASLDSNGLLDSDKFEKMKDDVAGFRAELTETGQKGTLTLTQLEKALTKVEAKLDGSGDMIGERSRNELVSFANQLTRVVEQAKKPRASLFKALEQEGLEANTVIAECERLITELELKMRQTGKIGTTTYSDLEHAFKRVNNVLAGNESARGTQAYNALLTHRNKLEEALNLASKPNANIAKSLTSAGLEIETVFDQTNKLLSMFDLRLIQTGKTGTVTLEKLRNALKMVNKELAANRNSANQRDSQGNSVSTYDTLQNDADFLTSVIGYVENGSGMSVTTAIEKAGREASTALDEIAEHATSFKLELIETGRSGTMTMGDLNSAILNVSKALAQCSRAANKQEFSNLQATLVKMEEIRDIGKTKGLGIDDSLDKTGVSDFYTTMRLAAEHTQELKLITDKIPKDVDDANRAAAEFAVTMRSLSGESSKLRSALNGIDAGGLGQGDADTLNDLKSRSTEIEKQIELARRSKAISANDEADIRARISAINQETDALLKNIGANTANNKAGEAGLMSDQKRVTMYAKIQTAIDRVTKAQKNWTASQRGTTSSEFGKLGGYLDALEELRREVGALDEQTARERLAGINDQFLKTQGIIRGAGEDTKTFLHRLRGLGEKFTAWLSASQIVEYVWHGLQNMVRTVVEIDTAMTELKKVTDETDTVYTKFLDNAIVRAKELGAKVSDVVTATADFARLGFTIDEATTLADAAIVYKNVGDGIENISVASESIISTMKAFGMEANEAMSIVDRFNIVGKFIAQRHSNVPQVNSYIG